MSFETELTAFLQTATGLVVHWDTTPANFAAPDGFILVNQMGGRAQSYAEGSRNTSKHARLQIKLYHVRAMERDRLALLVEDALAESIFTVSPYGAPIKGFEDAIDRYESIQHFGFWYSVT